jgi:diadenosine tetraphosphate (Ap4A) HIT family hydrolase
MTDCLSCKVVSGEITPPGGVIYTGRYWIVNHVVGTQLLRGFLIIQPKRHCEHLAELTAGEAAEFGTLMQITCRALADVVAPAKTYLCSFGETHKHIHFWVLPRYADMVPDGFHHLEDIVIHQKHICTEAESAEIAHKVRERMMMLLEQGPA